MKTKSKKRSQQSLARMLVVIKIKVRIIIKCELILMILAGYVLLGDASIPPDGVRSPETIISNSV